MVAALALLVANAFAAPRVHPILGDGPHVAQSDSVRAVAVFDGGPARVAVRRGTKWVTIATDAPSPVLLPKLAAGTPVRITQAQQEHLIAFLPTWTPADAAAWSGPGLRGAWVTGMAGTLDASALWVGTDGGGVARWNGQHWAHLDRRTVLPDEHVLDFAVSDDVRWTRHPQDIMRLLPDGTATWMRPPADAGFGRTLRLNAMGDGDAWVVSQAGILKAGRAHPLELVVARPDCSHVFGSTALGFMASCDRIVRMPSGDVIDVLPTNIHPTAWLPRVGGAWVGTAHDGLWSWLDGNLDAVVSVPFQAVHDLERVGDAMLVLGDGGATVVRDDAVVRLSPAMGIAAATATAIAPGPSFGKAWLGTQRGVSLINAAGTGTPLPMAPLPAGEQVLAIAQGSHGLAVASDGGLTWLGDRAPVGWQNLVAAVGAPVVDVAVVGRTWWAMSGEAAYALDKTGSLTRWPMHADGVAVVPSRGGMALVSSEGVQWWMPDARVLSPLQPVQGVRQAASGGDGSLWLAGASGVHHVGVRGMESWLVAAALAVHPSGPGAVIGTEEGVVFVSAGSEDIGVGWAGAKTGAIRAIASHGARLALAGADGRLWVGTPQGPEALVIDQDAAVVPTAMVGDAHGLWIGTDRGLYRVNPP